jgi:hypothetical protein
MSHDTLRPRNEAFERLRATGLLFEINRRVLHPLGLALAVEIDDETKRVTDVALLESDDEEGLIYSNADLLENVAKLYPLLPAYNNRMGRRQRALGYIIQPLPESEPAEPASAILQSVEWPKGLLEHLKGWLELYASWRESLDGQNVHKPPRLDWLLGTLEELETYVGKREQARDLQVRTLLSKFQELDERVRRLETAQRHDVLCEHTNETPPAGGCTCPPDCVCRDTTCERSNK